MEAADWIYLGPTAPLEWTSKENDSDVTSHDRSCWFSNSFTNRSGCVSTVAQAA